MSPEKDPKQNPEKQPAPAGSKRRSTPQAAGGNPRSQSDDKPMTAAEMEEAQAAKAGRKKPGG
jgi:hypothetical protein